MSAAIRSFLLLLVCLILAAFIGFAVRDFVLFGRAGLIHTANGIGLFAGFSTLLVLLWIMTWQQRGMN